MSIHHFAIQVPADVSLQKPGLSGPCAKQRATMHLEAWNFLESILSEIAAGVDCSTSFSKLTSKRATLEISQPIQVSRPPSIAAHLDIPPVLIGSCLTYVDLSSQRQLAGTLYYGASHGSETQRWRFVTFAGGRRKPYFSLDPTEAEFWKSMQPLGSFHKWYGQMPIDNQERAKFVAFWQQCFQASETNSFELPSQPDHFDQFYRAPWFKTSAPAFPPPDPGPR